MCFCFGQKNTKIKILWNVDVSLLTDVTETTKCHLRASSVKRRYQTFSASGSLQIRIKSVRKYFFRQTFNIYCGKFKCKKCTISFWQLLLRTNLRYGIHVDCEFYADITHMYQQIKFSVTKMLLRIVCCH